MTDDFELNARACEITAEFDNALDELRIELHDLPNGGRLYDFGVNAVGGLQAGLALAEVCMSGLGEVWIEQESIDGIAWPHVSVMTDHAVAACLFSQYAGWQIEVGKYFAIASGPMRAAAAREELFEKLNYREQPDELVGVLESGKLPGGEVFEMIAQKTGVPASAIDLLVAPTSSQAGNLQVVARSVETAMHKLFELGFDVTRVAGGLGTAPLPPVAADDMTGIGRTNDAILYGACVTLWVTGDDDSLVEIGPKVPALASKCYGKPFSEIFEEAGRDFYQIDPHLFSPAEIVLQNIDTGRVHRFGQRAPDVLRKSFGL